MNRPGIATCKEGVWCGGGHCTISPPVPIGDGDLRTTTVGTVSSPGASDGRGAPPGQRVVGIDDTRDEAGNLPPSRDTGRGDGGVARRVTAWLLHGQAPEPEGFYEGEAQVEKQPQHHPQPWYKVMCLTGVDYFSTLGYQPGIAA